LSDDKSTLRSNHHTLAQRTIRGHLNCFQKATRNAGGTLNSGTVIEFSIVIGRAILDPMTYSEDCVSSILKLDWITTPHLFSNIDGTRIREGEAWAHSAVALAGEAHKAF
jgi:hypothetical protein